MYLYVSLFGSLSGRLYSIERLLLIHCYDGCVTVAILLKCDTCQDFPCRDSDWTRVILLLIQKITSPALLSRCIFRVLKAVRLLDIAYYLVCAYIEYIIKGYSDTQRLVGCKYTLTIGLNSNRRSLTITAGGWKALVLPFIFYILAWSCCASWGVTEGSGRSPLPQHNGPA